MSVEAPNDPAGPVKRKAPRWMKIVLVLSLMLNVVGIGAVGARAWMIHKHGHGGPSMHALGLHSFLRKLPRERRHELREKFRSMVQEEIGHELNGYHLEDSAIDHLEQTPIELLDEKNILDAEGIKKITDLTAAQKVLANQIERDKNRFCCMEVPMLNVYNNSNVQAPAMPIKILYDCFNTVTMAHRIYYRIPLD